MDELGAVLDDTDRLVIVLSGRFATVGGEVFYLPTDIFPADQPGVVAMNGLPVSALIGWLERRPGESALFLGVDTSDQPDSDIVQAGIGPMGRVPQGVMVATGTPRDVATALGDRFLQPGVTVAEAAARSPALTFHGFVSPHLMLGGGTAPRSETVATEAQMDEAWWRVAEELGSKMAYDAYLRRFPSGAFADLARQRLAEIAAATPQFTPEEQAERALALTREDRRDVQRWLNLLGYDPRGIDGLFGPGTRSALTRWQGQNGFAATGFLNADTLSRLRNQADRRAAELRAEAERKKAEQDRQDAAFWRQTGARGTEADLRAYLAKYPDGLYADIARTELDRIEAQNRLQAQAADRAAWDAAVRANTAAAYDNYLQAYPRGAFAAQAQARLDEIEDDAAQRDDREAAQAEEAQLGLTPETRLLSERKLAALQFDPGQVDGEFDRQTRRAIRRYQRSRDLPVSGFLTRQTAVRLFSE